MKKLNNKGFTLIEILSVIAILLVISTITVVSTVEYKKNSQNKTYKKIVTNIETAAESFVEVNRSDIPFNDDGVYYIKLKLLVDTGYVKAPIKNPKDGKDISLETWVQVTKMSDNSLEYNYPADVSNDKNPNNPNDLSASINIKITYQNKDVTNGEITVDASSLPIKNTTLKSFATVTYTPNDVVERYKRLDVTPSSVNGAVTVTYAAYNLLNSLSTTATLTIKTETTIVDKILPNCKKNSLGLYEGDECYFKGDDPNNYLWYSGYTWRIVGVNEDGTIKAITKNPIANLAWGENKKTYEESFVRQWLNELDGTDNLDGIFYNSLKDPTSYLVKRKWDISSVPSEVKESTFEDYVGMITEREYQRASTDEASKKEYIYGKENWLNINSEYMTMTLSGYDREEIYVRNINEDGNTVFRTQQKCYGLAHKNVVINGISYPPTNFCIANPEGVRPVVNFKKDIKLNGQGTSSNPYTIEGEIKENNNSYIKSRYPGEYVSFSGYTWRIVDTSSGKTKLILNDVLKDSSGKVLTKAYDTRCHDNNTKAPYTQIEKYDPTATTNIAYYLNDTYYNSLTDNSLLSQGYFHNSKFSYGGDYRKAISAQKQEEIIKQVNNSLFYTDYYYNDVDTYVGIPSIGELFSGNDLYISNYGDTPLVYATQIYNDTDLLFGKQESKGILYLYSTGKANSSIICKTPSLIRPTVYLSSTVKIKGGTGTPNDPYTVYK